MLIYRLMIPTAAFAGMQLALDQSRMTWRCVWHAPTTLTVCEIGSIPHALSCLNVTETSVMIALQWAWSDMIGAGAGAKHVVVMDGAYHGHTTATIDLSPYKFNGPGGSGRCADLAAVVLARTNVLHSPQHILHVQRQEV